MRRQLSELELASCFEALSPNERKLRPSIQRPKLLSCELVVSLSLSLFDVVSLSLSLSVPVSLTCQRVGHLAVVHLLAVSPL